MAASLLSREFWRKYGVPPDEPVTSPHLRRGVRPATLPEVETLALTMFFQDNEFPDRYIPLLRRR